MRFIFVFLLLFWFWFANHCGFFVSVCDCFNVVFVFFFISNFLFYKTYSFSSFFESEKSSRSGRNAAVTLCFLTFKFLLLYYRNALGSVPCSSLQNFPPQRLSNENRRFSTIIVHCSLFIVHCSLFSALYSSSSKSTSSPRVVQFSCNFDLSVSNSSGNRLSKLWETVAS